MALFTNKSRDLKDSLDDIELQIRDNLNHYVNESSGCTSLYTTHANSGLNLIYIYIYMMLIIFKLINSIFNKNIK